MRISTNLANQNVQNNLRLQESKLNNANLQMSSQQRIQNLRDDPLAAGHLVRYQSYAHRVERFEKNAQTLTDQFSVVEGYVNQSVSILQRIRELAVTGANGIYGQDDLSNMALEVDSLLQELIQNANAIGPDGKALFAGTRSTEKAFEAIKGPVKGSGDSLVTNVRYNGSIGENAVEIDEQSFLSVNKSGNKIFWAEQQQLFSNKDALAFQVQNKSEIAVDGEIIALQPGDNIYSIIAKINDSGAAVKASLDPVTKGLNLQTTDSRQLWLEDVSGNVLENLGVIKDKSQLPPYNLAVGVTVSGGSMFDSVVSFRDALLSGDVESIGGRVLGSLDSALKNTIAHLTEIGSNHERAQQSIARAETNNLNVTSMIAREGDLDITQAITDMKMMEYVHQASLSTAAKLYDNTLLNYMR